MTDKEFIKFSKEYFGDLDYTKLSEAEYKDLYEQKEAERINGMIADGKINLENLFSLTSDGMTVTLNLNGKPISHTTLTYYNPAEVKLV